MTLLESILLGVVQGATEFLPVSSSGHLVLAQYFLGADEPNRLFDVILHVGTLAAIVVFYRTQIVEILKDLPDALEKRTWNRGARITVGVIIASIPTAIIGLLIEKFLLPEELSVLSMWVSVLLIVNGFILVLNKRAPHADTPLESFEFKRGFWIGVSQGFGVLPGISRSGTTITAALFLKLERSDAAMFSFLMSVPAILGALLLKLDDVTWAADPSMWINFLVGAVAAAITGFFCIQWLVTLLKKAQFHHFAWYCWAVGICGLIATIVK